MKNNGNPLKRFRSISEIHQAFGLSKPKHPLISLVHFDENSPFNLGDTPIYDVLDFYKITFNIGNSGRLKYGQGYYDFNNGSMLFVAPNQLVGSSAYSGEAQIELLLSFTFAAGLPKRFASFVYRAKCTTIHSPQAY